MMCLRRRSISLTASEAGPPGKRSCTPWVMPTSKSVMVRARREESAVGVGDGDGVGSEEVGEDGDGDGEEDEDSEACRSRSRWMSVAGSARTA